MITIKTNNTKKRDPFKDLEVKNMFTKVENIEEKIKKLKVESVLLDIRNIEIREKINSFEIEKQKNELLEKYKNLDPEGYKRRLICQKQLK